MTMPSRRAIALSLMFALPVAMAACGQGGLSLLFLKKSAAPLVTGIDVVTLADADAALVPGVTVTITFDQAMDTTVNPSPAITGLASAYTITGTTWSAGGTRWSGVLDFNDDGEEATGTYSIAGFRSAKGVTMLPDTTHTVAVDTVNPVFTVTGPASGSPVNTVRAGFTVSEPLASGVITWDYAGGNVDGILSHTYTLSGGELNGGTLNIPGLDRGTMLVDGAIYAVTFTGWDAAGNPAMTATVTGITYDPNNPRVTAVSLTDLDEGDAGLPVSVSLTFSRGMDTAIDPSPTITGLHSDYTITRTGWSAGNTVWTGSFIFNDDGEEGSGIINITGFADAFGNAMAPDSTHNITVDTLSQDNDLSSLTITPGALTPPFAAGTTTYATPVPVGAEEVSVTATAAHPQSTIGITASSGDTSSPYDLSAGDTVITVTVTAESGDQKQYAITVSRWLRFVNLANTSPGDGRSWSSAYNSVQQGINAAESAAALNSAGVCEVWVARGTYEIFASGPGDKVLLKPGVAVYGGFKGTETRRGSRDYAMNATTLDGDNNGSRVNHVMVGSDNAVIDGFVVTGGGIVTASGTDAYGGGMRNDNCAPTVRNCFFFNNVALYDGGAIYNSGASSIVEHCCFVNNVAKDDGGALSFYNAVVQPTITGCVFIHNMANDDGGAVYFTSSGTETLPVILRNCTFINNLATDPAITLGILGGGIAIVSTSYVRIESTLFYLNVAKVNGGALYVDNSSAWMYNATVIDNQALGTENPAGVRAYNSGNLTLINTIVRNNTNYDISIDGSAATVRYSDYKTHIISGTASWSEAMCIDADPLFRNVSVYDLRLSAGSPCINEASTGDAPVTDFAGGARVDAADMGAHEFYSKVRYVDVNSNASSPDGVSWEGAFPTIQQGIDAASAVAGSCEVWVAEGNYRTRVSGPGNTLRLKQNVYVYGGFSGSETAFTSRNLQANVAIIDGYNAAETAKVYHVVTGNDAWHAMLDGFTIRNGDATAAADHGGGGMLVSSYGLGPALANCMVTGNNAVRGGALALSNGTSFMANCVFHSNTAANNGGALYLQNAQGVMISNTTISQNKGDDGGGIFADATSTASIVNSILWGNSNEHTAAPTDLTVETGGIVQLNYSDIGTLVGATAGNIGNLANEDPQFENISDPLSYNLHITTGSLCIDAADGGFASLFDIEGTPRFDDLSKPNTGTGTPNYADMGAYEYH